MEKILLLIILIIVSTYVIIGLKDRKVIEVKIQDNVINVEVAKTPTQKAKGLMGRKTMAENEGMLFIFDKEHYPSFWMFNTYIPLDMIWINKEKVIVDISRNVQPCTTIKDLCSTYSPNEKAIYVLEVNGNYTKNNNIKIGDKVEFDTMEL